MTIPDVAPKAQQKKWAKAARLGDLDARNKLVETNLAWTLKMASRYFTADHDLNDDIFAAACEGAMKAAETYDERRGTIFISFARWHIQKWIEDFLAQNNALHIPGAHTIRRTRCPSCNEITSIRYNEGLCDACGHQWQRHPYAHRTVETCEDAVRNAWKLPPSETAPDQIVDDLGHQQALDRLLDALTPEEQTIVELRHYENATYDEIRPIFGVSRQAIEQRYKRAMTKLRRRAKSLVLSHRKKV